MFPDFFAQHGRNVDVAIVHELIDYKCFVLIPNQKISLRLARSWPETSSIKDPSDSARKSVGTGAELTSEPSAPSRFE